MNYAVILASGSGLRAGGEIPKQFIEIKGKTILEYTISAFEKNKQTDRIILVVSSNYLDFCKKFRFKKLYKITEGGNKRQESSRLGVNLIEEENAKVLIHDGARPFITDEIINDCYNALDTYNAIDTGIETTDTIVQINKKGLIEKTLERSSLLRCQTPQGFRAGLIKKAHKLAKEKNIEVTDDVGLIVKLGLGEVFAVKGNEDNIKITYPKDIETAKEKL